jgi:hypothetical protein
MSHTLTASVLEKRPDTADEPPSAESCASHMPLLKVQNLENPMQQSRLYRMEIGSPTVSAR